MSNRTLVTLSLCEGEGLVPVGSYARLSDDKVGKAMGRVGVSADSQHDDGHAVARQRGWGVIRDYTDNDLSAFQDDVVRDEFERLLLDLEAWVIHGIVCYNIDRFLRRNDDLERVIKIIKKLKKRGRHAVFATAQGDIDLTTDEGQTVARYMTVGNNAQSAATSRRVERGHRLAAKAGKPAQMRGFGYAEDRINLCPIESKAIVDGADMLIKGQPIADVVRAWNTAGIRTVFGNEWVSSTVRQLYRTPRLVGLRVYQKNIMLDENGAEVHGQWRPILTREQWDAIQSILDGNSQKSAPATNEYLCSGIAICFRCGRKMYAQANTRWNLTTSMRTWALEKNEEAITLGEARPFRVGERGQLSPKVIAAYMEEYPNGQSHRQAFQYYCKAKENGRGSCGQNSISGIRVDRLIGQLMEARLTSRLIPDEAVAFDRQAELDIAQGQIAELMAAYRQGGLPGSVVFPEVSRLQTAVDSLTVERQRAVRDAERVKRSTETTPEDWRAASLTGKRAMLSLELAALVVKPSDGKGGVFDRSRVVPEWRALAG